MVSCYFFASNAGKGENLYSPIGNYQIPFIDFAIWKLYRSHLIFIFRTVLFYNDSNRRSFLVVVLYAAVDFSFTALVFYFFNFPPVASVVIY